MIVAVLAFEASTIVARTRMAGPKVSGFQVPGSQLIGSQFIGPSVTRSPTVGPVVAWPVPAVLSEPLPVEAIVLFVGSVVGIGGVAVVPCLGSEVVAVRIRNHWTKIADQVLGCVSIAMKVMTRRATGWVVIALRTSDVATV